MTQMLNLNLRLIFVLEIPKSCLIFGLSKWLILTAGTPVRRYPVLGPPVLVPDLEVPDYEQVRRT